MVAATDLLLHLHFPTHMVLHASQVVTVGQVDHTGTLNSFVLVPSFYYYHYLGVFVAYVLKFLHN